MPPARLPARGVLIRHAAQAVAVGLLLLYVLQGTLGILGQRFDEVVAIGVYAAVLALSGIACLARAATRQRERLPWLFLGIGLVTWAAGDVYLALVPGAVEQVPSLTDVSYWVLYVCSYVGVFLLIRRRMPGLAGAAWLDGITAGLVVGGVAALLFDEVLSTTGGSFGVVATRLSYPLADTLLVAMVVVPLVLMRRRPDLPLMLIGAGYLCVFAGDAFWLTGAAEGTWNVGNVLDGLFLVGALLIARAAWTGSPARSATQGPRAVSAIPTTVAALAVAVMIYAWLTDAPWLAAALAGAALVTVVARLRLTLAENARMLDRLHDEALTDPLTGLGNRRRLLGDLEHILAESKAGRLLALFDLDGFKAYNDRFGHQAGDELLEGLGAALSRAAGEAGTAYRLGGDEFCVLALPAGDPLMYVEALTDALSAQGADWRVTASRGVVVLHAEAATVSDALRCADERMYAHKRSRPARADITLAA